MAASNAGIGKSTEELKGSVTPSDEETIVEHLINVKNLFLLAIKQFCQHPTYIALFGLSTLDTDKQKKLADFLENRKTTPDTIVFDDFYIKLVKALAILKERDIDTIGTSTESSVIGMLRDILNMLNSIGLSSINSRSINFWSGERGRSKALEEKSLSDAEVPAVCALFLLGTFLKDDSKALLWKASSGIFAAHATGVVEVFISGDKASEPTSLIAGNNFWIAECPVLQRRLQTGIVTGIYLRIWQGEDKWSEPINLNHKEATKFLKIVRREAYTLDKISPNVPKHVRVKMLNDKLYDDKIQRFPSHASKEEWPKTEPRPSLSLIKLREITQLWKDKAKKTHESKKLPTGVENKRKPTT